MELDVGVKDYLFKTFMEFTGLKGQAQKGQRVSHCTPFFFLWRGGQGLAGIVVSMKGQAPVVR